MAKRNLLKVFGQRVRLVLLENSFQTIQTPTKETFDVREQLIIDRRMEMKIGGSSVVIFILFLITTLSCSQQRVNPKKIAKWPDKVKVAAVQIGGYDKWLKIKEGCNPVDSVVKYIEKAAADGVRLVVFPEYHLGRISVPGPQTKKISEAAAENSIYVIVGCWEVFEDESFSSTALLFGRDGDIVGKYYKTHAAVDTYDGLPAYSKSPSGKDKQWFIENDPEWIMKRGNDLPVFDLDFGRIGILICYDGYFSETCSVLSLKGAEIIVWINGRGGSIQDYYVRTFMEQNLVSMICTNQDYGSGTMLAQYPNKIDAICRQTGEKYITAEFNLKRLRIERL